MISKKPLFFILSFLFWTPTVALAELPDHSLIDKAKQEHGDRVQYALGQGAQVELTSDGKSYYVLWFPEGRDEKDPPPIIATMHGHAGCALADFYVWHRFVKERGYGLLAVQWWLGSGEGIKDYLLPNEIYRVIDQVFREKNILPGNAMLHGFSRGSANIYPVAAMDRSLGKNYFSLFVANAGRANSNYPPVAEIERGRYGDRPFEGSRWVTFAGGRDPNPDRDGIQGMRETADWLRSYGAIVELAIEDPDGDHGGFHRRPENCNKALDVFDRVKVS